ncbi:Kynureninase [Aphelenchoides besseyi]|nr:Kynureninase [Aphelenchoides besseyi]KAI6210800.1 Kynureninase [Aphelenchoides besseyi]
MSAFNPHILGQLKELAKQSEISDLSSRQLAQQLDKADKLHDLRNNFHIPLMGTLPEVDKAIINPEEESIYLCGNSLGLLPKATKMFIDEQLLKWSHMGVFGHHVEPVPWVTGDDCCIKGIQKLVGAQDGEVAMMNGLTVNLHILLTAFYKPTDKRFKVVIESRAFPSDHYAVESQIRLKGLDPANAMICLEPRDGEDLLREDDIIDFINKEADSVALVLLSGVQYYTGQFFDIPRITKTARDQGCIIGWDLAHAFANVPLHLHDWNVDFACWCTYKYGNTGAGSLAGIFVHNRHANDQRNRMLGWWSHKLETRFQMSNKLELAEGADGYRISNPPILLVCAVLGFLKAIENTNMEELREKSILLTGYLEFLIDYHFSAADATHRVKVEMITPREIPRRGCQLSLKFNCDIALIYEQLVKRGCAVDKRYPNVIRVAPVHFYNSFDDCWRFVNVLRESINLLNNEHQLKMS